MDDLRKELAPVPGEAWKVVEEEARRVLKLSLAGRKIVDFSGPHGWATSAVGTGTVERLKKAPGNGVEAALRQVQPLVELVAPFELSRADLDDVARGRKDPDLTPLLEAAKSLARAEDTVIFEGYAAAGIRGLREASPHPTLEISENYQDYPAVVAEGLRLLREAGVDGPYALALGPRCYAGLLRSTVGAYPVFELVRRVVGGPLVWAPYVDGAVLASLRGGDYELVVGRDISIGYSSHTDSSVRLYLVESLTFRVHTPEAAVSFVYARDRR
ncbi:MAG: bacteriocin [Candidatus Binatia bacterium]|nr:MAG: bacteriocin [Candidatus Binatia bacterium]